MSRETSLLPVTRREIVSWALYDFANSAFTTLIVTFIFSAYFAQSIAPDPIEGAIWWTRAVQTSAIIVAVVMPVLGAIADSGGLKKRLLFMATVACVVLTAALFWMGPGDAWFAALIFIGANVAYEITQVLYNSFLPEIATPQKMGRVSGFGWGVGYVGGLICLALALGMVTTWLPETDYVNIRATSLLTALWFLVFSIPTFLYLRERQPRRPSPIIEHVHRGFSRIRDTGRNLSQYRQAVRFLVARLVYNDGLVTVFAMAAIYAGAEFGLVTSEILLLGIVVNVAAGISAIIFGFVNDQIGGKKTITVTLVGLIGTTGLAFFAPDRTWFWVAAIFLGMMVGPNQAASRSLLASFVPQNKQAELFGFYAFSGKLASVLGPLSYGLVLGATESHRWALASVVIFFVVGLCLLARVDEEEGIVSAREGHHFQRFSRPTSK